MAKRTAVEKRVVRRDVKKQGPSYGPNMKKAFTYCISSLSFPPLGFLGFLKVRFLSFPAAATTCRTRWRRTRIRRSCRRSRCRRPPARSRLFIFLIVVGVNVVVAVVVVVDVVVVIADNHPSSFHSDEMLTVTNRRIRGPKL